MSDLARPVNPRPAPIEEPPRTPSGGPGRRKAWLSIAVVTALILVAIYALRGRSTGDGTAHPTPAMEMRPVPVTVANVVRRDVPVYLEGLGNVTAFKTVTVKTQVDGILNQVLFQEGQTVHRGQVLAQVDPRPFQIQLHQALGALARDEAQLKNARLNVERDRALVAEKLIAPQQFDTDVATAGQLEGSVAMDKATIETAQLNLEYARITSPLDGVTGIRQVDPGNVVHAADTGGIVVITQLDPIAVLFTLPQDELTPIANELAHGSLPVSAYSRDGNVLLGTGQLALIDNQINQTTSTIRLKAIVPNPRHVLWPNQFVNVRLHLNTRRNVLTMPATAVQRGPNGQFAYVVGSDLTVSPRPIETALTQGDITVISSGAKEGERVVSDGQNQLRSGSRVAVREDKPPKVPGGSEGQADRPRAGSPAR